MPAELSGGQLVARTLKEMGVEVLFTLCGNHLLPIYEGCVQEGIRLIDTRSEPGAVMAADAYARVTRRPAVALVTGGPGHTNALTGLATAHAAGSPVVLLSGQADMATEGSGALQEMDQVTAALPVSKWSVQAKSARRLPELLAEALRMAANGRTGGVHLSVPTDVVRQKVPAPAVPARPPVDHLAGTRPGLPQVQLALDMLRGARRPVLVAGSGAYFGRAEAAMTQLIEACGLPLFTVDMARGMVPDDHPLCFGYADPSLSRVARRISEADVVIVLGKRLDYRVRNGGLFAPAARLVCIDADAFDIGRNRTPELGVVCSVAGFCETLAEAAAGRQWNFAAWVEELRAEAAAQEAEFAAVIRDAPTEGALHPMSVARALRQGLGGPVTLVLDGGDFVQWCRSGLTAQGPGRWLRLGALATIGAGTPMAVGARAARPDERVLLICGDGGAGYYPMEFETALRHGLPFVAVVGNDAAWGIERHFQVGLYGPEYAVATRLSPVRFDRVVQALGGYGEQVERLADLVPAVERAFASGLPACINVPTLSVPSPMTRAVISRGGTV